MQTYKENGILSGEWIYPIISVGDVSPSSLLGFGADAAQNGSDFESRSTMCAVFQHAHCT